jgi:hypothetical protein
VAAHVICGGCNLKVPLHCESGTCPWVKCPDHGLIAMTPDQRKFLHGEGKA